MNAKWHKQKLKYYTDIKGNRQRVLLYFWRLQEFWGQAYKQPYRTRKLHDTSPKMSVGFKH